MQTIAANGFYKNRTEFCKRHVIWSSYTDYPKIERYFDTDRLEKLKAHILIEMEVKRKTIPHKIIEDVSYDKKLYDQVLKEKWNIYEEKPIENAAQFMSVIRQVVNNDPSRCEKIKQIIDSHHKVIIFYNFNYERESLFEMAKQINITIKEWNGHNHESLPDTNEWIYLVQYNAGSEGWECTITDTIIFYSLSYSYRMMVQAAGRIDRRNTTFKDLYYFYLISKSPLDSSILKSLKNKRDFNQHKYCISLLSQEKQSLL